MIYSHSALSLHPWEDMEAERIWSLKKSSAFALMHFFVLDLEHSFDCFTSVCLPLLQQ